MKPNKNENRSELNKHFHVRKDITEYVRQIADKNLMMTFAIIIINFFLSIFGKGDTLKVFWMKK